MKNFILLFFLLNTYQPIYANEQVHPADSLERAFNTASSDTARLSILFKDIPFKYLGHPDQMIALYHRGFELAQHVQDKTNNVKALFYTAMIYMYDKTDEGTGFQWLQKTLSLAEEQQDNFYIQRCYYAMSILYHHQGNTKKMYETLFKSVEYNEKISNPETSAFNALSQNLFDDKRYDEYLSINKRLVALMEKTNAPDKDKLNAYNSLADALKIFPNEKQEYNYYFKKAAALLNKIPELGNDPDKLLIAASIYFKFNRYEEAIKYANKILDLSDTDDFTLSSKGLAHKFLGDLYEHLKNYPLSISHLRTFQSIEVEQMKKRLSEDSGRKIIKAEAERDLVLKQKEVDKQKWYSILGFSIAALVLLGGIIAYRFYKREQERKQELANINATKDKLFSIIAHDLRAPIGTLKTYLDLTDFGLMSQAEFAKASQKLTNNVNALFQTLDNLLQWSYSQLKGINAQPETINLHEVANTELRFLNEIAQHKNITVTNNISPDATAYVDINQMSLIIRNILSNALKFTHSGGHVVLHSANTEGDKTILKISDNGIGMPSDIQEQLFSIHEKTSRAGTAYEKGQGLGLIVVQEMIEANHSSIKVESTENQGTTISITLPNQ